MVMLATSLLVLVAVVRRVQGRKFFHFLDQLRQLVSPRLHLMLQEGLSYEDGLKALQQLAASFPLRALESVLLESELASRQIATLRRLCEDLGLVKVWQDQLQLGMARLPGWTGWIERFKPLRFVSRVRAARNLGLIEHQSSWPLLVRALDDPDPEVQWAATRSLGAIREPASFAALARRLESQVLSTTEGATGCSARATRSSMTRFPLRCAAALASMLDHKDTAVRLEASEVVRVMLDRAAGASPRRPQFTVGGGDFPPELAEKFLTGLSFDSNPDVRARTASVLGFVAGWRAEAVLARLLSDEVWFVRLHAVRALAQPRFQFLASRVARLLTDSYWRVREAATQTLLAQGGAGVSELMQHFFGESAPEERRCNGDARTPGLPDLYSREQIAEQMHRSGLLHLLAGRYEEWARRNGSTAISQLARAGRGAFLLATLDDARHAPFMKGHGEIAPHRDEECPVCVALPRPVRQADPEKSG